jgi:hypothetical protein
VPMAIEWNVGDLLEFFGKTEWEGGDAGLTMFDFPGALLNYQIHINEEEETVFVSGDTEQLFGADSLFEFSIACNPIRLVDEPYHAGQKGLEFRYVEGEGEKHAFILSLKRPDGNLGFAGIQASC